MSDQHDSDDDKPVCLYRTTSDSEAEALRMLLIQCEIHAAVWTRDPVGLLCGMAEILVFSTEHARAAALVKEFRQQSGPDWCCASCEEPVPANFDICWNCGESRVDEEFVPSASADQPTPQDEPLSMLR